MTNRYTARLMGIITVFLVLVLALGVSPARDRKPPTTPTNLRVTLLSVRASALCTTTTRAAVVW